jgi:hypothetical protein
MSCPDRHKCAGAEGRDYVPVGVVVEFNRQEVFADFRDNAIAENCMADALS